MKLPILKMNELLSWETPYSALKQTAFIFTAVFVFCIPSYSQDSSAKKPVNRIFTEHNLNFSVEIPEDHELADLDKINQTLTEEESAIETSPGEDMEPLKKYFQMIKYTKILFFASNHPIEENSEDTSFFQGISYEINSEFPIKTSKEFLFENKTYLEKASSQHPGITYKIDSRTESFNGYDFDIMRSELFLEFNGEKTPVMISESYSLLRNNRILTFIISSHSAEEIESFKKVIKTLHFEK